MFIPVELPPGVIALGTHYQSKGRFRYTDLMRWENGSLRPVGGWRKRSTSPMDGVSRAVLTWVTNNGTAWIGVGTNTNLYAITRSGSVNDITPASFTPGPADASMGGGYGTGLYGTDLYGTVRADSTSVIPAASWTIDTFGENLVGLMDSEGIIYEWEPDPLSVAVPVANAPTAGAIVTTQENILMALGAYDGISLNPRYIKWSAIQDNTDWTPTAVNQARDATLQTQGEIMTAKRVPGGLLVLTDEGAFLGSYVGPPFVYTFARVGSGCGIISRQAVAVTQAVTYWWGPNGFYQYNGFAQPLECDVQEHIFGDINLSQISKISAFLNSDYNEVWWFYPSSSSLELDRYVAFNFLDGIWHFGRLDRTCGTGANGVLQYPLLVGQDGYVYDHEVDSFRDGRTATARTGPVELGNGDQVIMLKRYIPDEGNTGTVDVTFHMKQWPNGAEITAGPFDSTSPTDLRLTARQMEIEYVVAPDIPALVGSFRFDAQAGGKR